MRRTATFAASLAGLVLLTAAADAQQSYRTNGPLRLDVRPRSFLDAGPVVRPFSSVNPASGYGQTVSYLNNPPYMNMNSRFGADVLPDPVTNTPFPGGQTLLGPIDFTGELD